jgi:hydroxypyruvate reductase
MIENADELGGTPARETALACLEAGIGSVLPDRVVERSVSLSENALVVDDLRYDLDEYDRVVVLGGGKAAGGVARALEALLGDRIDDGIVVAAEPAETDRIEVAVGDHPVPTERSVEGARRVLELAAEADERTLILAVVTGGASSLLAAPAEGVSLADLRATTDALLDSGAEIAELNAVRKHLSAIKGGRLAAAAAPATILGLVVSDVVGNDLSVIASGPTAPDDSTYADALDVLDRYAIAAPEPVRNRLERGARGDLDETPRRADAIFERVENRILADGFTALAAARDVAADRGYATCVLSSRVRGEAREAAKVHVAVAEEMAATGNPVEPRAVVLSGGETTVTVRGDGRGGPNLEFALSGAIELSDGVPSPARGVALASVDTDGRDGSTDAAGALVDAKTVDDPAEARAALAENDAQPYLAERAATVATGPTGTNVNDLRVLVIESNASVDVR